MKSLLYKLSTILRSPSGRIYLAGWCGIALQLLVAHIMLGVHSFGQVLYATLLASTDATFVMIPFWLLPRRLRWTMLLPLLILPVFLIANIWNYRFTGTMLTGTGLLQIGSVNAVVINSTSSLMRPLDLLLPVIAIAAAIPYFRLRKRATGDRVSPTFRLTATIAALVVWSIPQFFASACYNPKYFDGETGLKRWRLAAQYRWKELSVPRFKRDGIVCFTFEQILIDMRRLRGLRTLSDAETAEITEFIEATPGFSQNFPVFQQNRNKNLIYIIVESLNGQDVERSVGGRPLMPVLSSLIDSPGTIATTNMWSQIGNGISSDGHLIIMTGLTAMESMIYSLSLSSSTTVPSITGAMPERDTWLVKGNDAHTWNSDEYWKSFGFNNYYSSERILTHDEELSCRLDEKLFNTSLQLMEQAPQPFIFSILTMSMHSPFTYGPEQIPEHIKNAPELHDDTDRLYLATVNYFDSCLGDFIDGLKARNLYDNSVIIIVSDHSQILSKGEDALVQQICFMALNTGHTQRIDRTSGQIDVYPTVMQIMGLDSVPYFRGFGTSILDPQLNAAILRDGSIAGDTLSPLIPRMQQAIHISTNIMQGNYFKNRL